MHRTLEANKNGRGQSACTSQSYLVQQTIHSCEKSALWSVSVSGLHRAIQSLPSLHVYMSPPPVLPFFEGGVVQFEAVDFFESVVNDSAAVAAEDMHKGEIKETHTPSRLLETPQNREMIEGKQLNTTFSLPINKHKATVLHRSLKSPCNLPYLCTKKNRPSSVRLAGNKQRRNDKNRLM